MMSVTASPASILSALMPTETAAPPEQPGTNAMQFAALMAGAVMPAKTDEIDAGTATPETAADDQAGEDMPTDDGTPQQDTEAETDPLAAALAMLPVAMQQAVVAAPVTVAAGETQPMPTISNAALSKMLRGKSEPKGETVSPTGTKAPFVPSEVEGRAAGVTLAVRTSTSLGTNGVVVESADEAPEPAGIAVRPQQTEQKPQPQQPLQPQQPQQVASLLQRMHAVPASSDQPDTDDTLPTSADTKADRAVDAVSTADAVAAAAPAPVHHMPAATPDIDTSKITAPADNQLQLGHALAQQHLKIASDGQWLDQLARDIARTADGDGKLSFHLNPEHLGSLTVEVTRGAEGTSVRLTADTDAARTILIDAQPKLEAEARAQGVKIVETHVDLGGGATGQGVGGQGAAGQGSLGQGGRQQQAPAEPMLRTIRAGDFAAGVTTNTKAAGRSAAAERYA